MKNDFFAHIHSDDRLKGLFGIAGKVYRDAQLLSSLEPEKRIIEDLDDLKVIIEFFKIWDANIVLTMGTFDLLHVGHARYVKKARNHGEILIVGVEDDKKARGRKGENRPAVPYNERSELLTHLRYADLVAMKSFDQEKWAMIKVVQPNTLVAVNGTYSPEELKDLEKYCKKIIVLERQAETSTSAQIRRMALDGADTFKKAMMEELPSFANGVYEKLKGGK